MELEDYISRAMDYIRDTHRYSETELLGKHEVEFFRTLRRVEDLHRKKIRDAEERRAVAEARRRR